MVAPAAGLVRETVGGVVSLLLTVTVTAVEVVVLPVVSRARAVRVWAPLSPMVSQETEYGAAVTSAPRLEPSSRNWTPATPTLSEAVADTNTVPDTVAPDAGAVTETVGGVVSAPSTGVFMSV